MTVILDAVHESISEDWEGVDWSGQSDRILEIYQQADSDTKKAIDEVMVCVCGYSIPSLVKISGG